MVIIKKKKKKQKIAIGEDMEKLNYWKEYKKGSVTVENTMAAPLKIKNRITIWSNNSTSEYISKKTESKHLKRYLPTHFHSSTINNVQKEEATQLFIIRWKYEENAVYTYN